MSKYIKYESEEQSYLICQGLGYSLVHEGCRMIADNKAVLLKESFVQNDNKKEVYDILINSMVFSEHYIEDSLFYKDFIKASRQRYDLLSQEEKENYDQESRDKELFSTFSDYLNQSTLNISTKIYKIPYLLDNKPLGMRVIDTVWHVYEKDVLIKYPMMTRTLICFVQEDGEYIHIEPEFGKSDLELPEMEVEKEEDYKGLSVPEIFRKGEERFIHKVINSGILVKTTI